tara:strand:+ start:88 stop:294 length:207 start_codon:yes stop_codon:yes gene_type:complete
MSILEIKQEEVHFALIKDGDGQTGSLCGSSKDLSLLLANALTGKPKLRVLFENALQMHDNYLKNTLNA